MNESAIPMLSGLIFNFLVLLFVYFALYKVNAISKKNMIIFSLLVLFVSCVFGAGLYSNFKTSDEATADVKTFSKIKVDLETYKKYHDGKLPDEYNILQSIIPEDQKAEVDGVKSFVSNYKKSKIGIVSKDDKVYFNYTISGEEKREYYYCISLKKEIAEKLGDVALIVNNKNAATEAEGKNNCNINGDNQYLVVLK